MTHTQVAFPLARGVHSRAPTDTEGILLRIGAKALKENVVAVDAAKPFALWAIEAFKLLDRLDNLAHREEALLRLKGASRLGDSATVLSLPNRLERQLAAYEARLAHFIAREFNVLVESAVEPFKRTRVKRHYL